MPIISGALGSTEIARANWEHFAAGAAISGVVLTCGENVCGIDPGLQLDKNGKIKGKFYSVDDSGKQIKNVFQNTGVGLIKGTFKS